MTVYNPAECIVLTRGKEPFGELLNMTAGFPIEWDNRIWKSSEALYQAARFPDLFQIQEDIRNASNGFTAKLVAKAHAILTRPSWMEGIRVHAMRQVLGLKYTQHERIREVLAETGTKVIVERSHRDHFWGATPCGDMLLGENMLGQLWIDIRTNIPQQVGQNYLPGATLDAFFA
jgi:type I restriction enzyme S subunit